MSSTYTRLKEYVRALSDYIALEPRGNRRDKLFERRVFENERTLCEKMENKQEIHWETQKYQSKFN
ncbi:hypothetical protein [Bacteroidetes bacterium endosymbiont of Geopemphigus sp.]|uniref:hypothetical protein n=1 Tax=Bacteroidetes bacterium endosymbiont of Geopemphigus sp. TaxID=2047937 RepID=UPI000CD29533|nr:hypothetical protein [Bacteroidetes bacterium endosymbiont of Geopemphigus sp.]